MKNKEEYKQLIVDALRGVVWERLQNALLGRELIYFGATVNEMISGQYDTLLKGLAPEYADYDGLAVLGYHQGVAYDLIRPTKAQLNISLVRGAKPFQLELQIGAAHFYNIAYEEIGEKLCTLYKGTVCYTTFTGPVEDAVYQGKYNPSGRYRENGRLYIKLPQNTLVNSLRIYLRQEKGPIPQQFKFVPGQSENVRVWRALDKTLCVGVKDMEGAKDLECYYLVGEYDTPDFNEGSLSSPSGEVSVKVELSQGANSVEAARESLILESGKVSALATREQVVEYANSFPQVKDSNPEVTENNKVTVWVKPEYKASYDAIEEGLRLYGELVMDWRVEEGAPIKFQISLAATGAVLAFEQRALIENRIYEWIAENLRYTTEVSTAWLMQAIPEYISQVSLVMRVAQVVTGTQISLVATPTEGSIEIEKDDKVVAWDGRGYLKGYLTSATIATRVGKSWYAFSHIENDILFTDGAQVFIANGNDAVACNEELFSIKYLTGEIFSLVDLSEIMLTDGKRARIYSADYKFGNGKLSLMRDPDQNVSWVVPTGTGSLQLPELQASVNYNGACLKSREVFIVGFGRDVQLLQLTITADRSGFYLQKRAILSVDRIADVGAVTTFGDELLVLSMSSSWKTVTAWLIGKDITDSNLQSAVDVSGLKAWLDEHDDKIKGTQITSIALRGASLIILANGKTVKVLYEITSDLSMRSLKVVDGVILDEEFTKVLSESSLGKTGKVYDFSGESLSSESELNWITNVGMVDYTNAVISIYNGVYTELSGAKIEVDTLRIKPNLAREYPLLEEGGIKWD